MIHPVLMANQAGLLAAFLKIGHQSIGQTAMRPGDYLETGDGVIVKYSQFCN